MTLRPELFNAMLSMDAYNRGYDASIKLPTIVNATKLGHATITAAIRDDDTSATDIGFYALAYDTDGDGNADIVAYRGTDYPQVGQKTLGIPNDVFHGWSLGNGITASEQGRMAVDFYQEVAGDGNHRTADISLTGHSLGGGLAGYVGSLYDQNATIFDSMDFKAGADSTYDRSVNLNVVWQDGNGVDHNEELTPAQFQQLQNDPSNTIVASFIVDPILRTIVYGSEEPWVTNENGITGHGMNWEILGLSPWSPSSNIITKYDILDGIDLIPDDYSNTYNALYNSGSIALGLLVDVGSNLFAEAVARHSQATLIITMFKDEVSNLTDWQAASQYFWPVMYDDGFAGSIGMTDNRVDGELQDQGQYADILRGIIAYSVIDEGERPFGDTGIRALYDDANDLGKALVQSGDGSIIQTLATDISKAFLHFAGQLALNSVLKDGNADALKGILTYDPANGQNELVVNLSDDYWTLLINTPDHKLNVTRDSIVPKVIQTLGYDPSSVLDIAQTLYGDNTAALYDRIVFGFGDNKTSIIPEAFSAGKVSLFVGHETNDIVNGSTTGDLIFGNGGDDVLRGGAGSDILVGGAGDDTADYSLDGSNGASGGVDVTAFVDGGFSVTDGFGDTDSLSEIENIIFTEFADTLNVNASIITAGTDTVFDLSSDDRVNLTGGVYNANTNELYNTDGTGTITLGDASVVAQNKLDVFIPSFDFDDPSLRPQPSDKIDYSSYEDSLSFTLVAQDSLRLLTEPLENYVYTHSQGITLDADGERGRVWSAGGWGRGAVVNSHADAVNKATQEGVANFFASFGTFSAVVVGSNNGDTLEIISQSRFGPGALGAFEGGTGNDTIILRDDGYRAPEPSDNFTYIYTGGFDAIENAHLLGNVFIKNDFYLDDSFFSLNNGNLSLFLGGGNVLILENALDDGGNRAPIRFSTGGSVSVVNGTIVETGSSSDDVIIQGTWDHDTWDGVEGKNQTYTGKGGDDRAFGNDGDDILSGGLGNDTLDGGEGDDTLFGGSGDDTFVYSGGLDRFEDKDGTNDTVTISGGFSVSDAVIVDDPEGLRIIFDLGIDELLLAGQFGNGNNAFENINFGSGLPDTYSFDDIQISEIGSVLTASLNAPSILTGSAFDDTLLGGNENDILTDVGGSNVLDGGAGDDLYVISALANSILSDVPGGFNHVIINDLGFSDLSWSVNGASLELVDSRTTAVFATLQGFENFSTLTLGNTVVDVESLAAGAPITFVTTDNADILTAESLDTGILISLKDGQDLFRGSDFKDIIYGDAGSNVIYGRAGDDSIFGGSGPSTIFGDAGNDFIDGGTGPSFVYYTEAPSGVIVNLNDNIAQEDGYGDVDTLINIQCVGGSDFADDITGTMQFNNLFGESGNDVLRGLGGHDFLNGGDGDDALYGDEGDDNLRGDAGDDELFGGAGNDNITSGEGNDFVDGGTGVNELDYSLATGGVDIDLQAGRAFDDGYGTEDTIVNIVNIRGSEHTDILRGDDQDNRIIGGGANSGDDVFEGRGGNDELIGGQGNNTYIFAAGDGFDTIFDGGGNDTLLIDSTTIALSDLRFSRVADDLVIDIASGVTIKNQFSTDASSVVEFAGFSNQPVFEIPNLFMTSGFIALGERYSVDQDGSLFSNLLENELDVAIGGLSVDEATFVTANGGLVQIFANGDFNYSPVEGFFGTDSFEYTVINGTGQTSTARTDVNVIPTDNDSLNFSNLDLQNDVYVADEDNEIIGNVLDNDSSIDGSDFNVIAETVVSTQGVQVEIQENGDFIYTPEQNFFGSDGFSYQAVDENGVTGIAFVDIAIVPVNDAPEAQDDDFSGDEDTQIIGNLLSDNGNGADSDIEGDALSVQTATITTLAGAQVVISDTGDFTYMPLENFNGADSFEYTLLDGEGGSSIATANITLNPVNDNPVVADDEFTGEQDQIVSGNVLNDNGNGSDSDVDGDVLSVEAMNFTTAQGGAVELLANGDFTYTPLDGYTGADSFAYTLLDGQGGSVNGQVDLTIEPVNVADIIGTERRDFLYGTNEDELILALGGNDYIFSCGGDDEIHGGQGRDWILSGSGNDSLFGDEGRDYLISGWGDDELYGGSGKDYLSAGFGDDILNGGDGRDYLFGSHGNDILNGGAGRDILAGGYGADTFVFDKETAFDGVDKIRDFKSKYGDAIDISDVLETYDPINDAINDFVQVTQHGSRATLSIDADGGGNNFVKVTEIRGTRNLDIDDMIDNGNLIVV